MPDNDLGLAMLELKMALEKFAEAFTAAVARDLKRQVEVLAAAYPPVPPPRQDLAVVKLDNLERVCPRAVAHEPHTWSFPKSSHHHRCPGRKGPEQVCAISYTHDGHYWYPEALGGVERRLCPGVTVARPTGEQCQDNLAHHEHQWSVPGPVDGDPVPVTTLVRWCHGLEEDLEVQWCGNQAPDTGNLTHAAHTWGHTEGARVVVFCRGRREPLERQCSRILPHTGHTHSIPIDEDRSVTYRCPGWSAVPAGADRHA